jgi:hypothetical protein
MSSGADEIQKHLDQLVRDIANGKSFDTRRIKSLIQGVNDSEQHSDYVRQYNSVMSIIDIKPQLDYVNRLDGSEKLRLYTNDQFYKRFNTTVRKGGKLTSEQTDIMKYIETAFTHVPAISSDNSLVLWRGLYAFGVDDIKFGKSVISCSLSYNVATGFAGRDCCLLKFIVGKGCKILPVFTVSEFDNELEVLLDYNCIFSYIGKEKVDHRQVHVFNVTVPGILANNMSLAGVLSESDRFERANSAIIKQQQNISPAKISDSLLEEIAKKLKSYLTETESELEDMFDREFEITEFFKAFKNLSDSDIQRIRNKID